MKYFCSLDCKIKDLKQNHAIQALFNTTLAIQMFHENILFPLFTESK